MGEPFVNVLGMTLSAYTWYVSLGAALLLSLWVAQGRRVAPAERWADAGLVALALALVGGRLAYVAIHAGYYQENPEEIWALTACGMSWHGALIGGIAGAWLGARLWRLRLDVQDAALAVGFPALAGLAWLGCGAAACAYGAEVATLAEHPAWLVAELRDGYGLVAPRYDTARVGVWLALALVGAGGAAVWRGWWAGYRWWLILCLFSSGMLIIGFIRGDEVPMWAGWRADQWLDLAVGAVAGALAFTKARMGRPGGADRHL